MRLVALAGVTALVSLAGSGGGLAERSLNAPAVDAVVATIQGPGGSGGLQGVALGDGGSRLYVSVGARTAVWDAGIKSCVAGPTADPQGHGSVAVYDAGTRALLADVPVAAGYPIHAELDGSTGRVYVASSPGGLSVFDGTSLVGSLSSLGGAPHDVGIDSSNEHALVSNTVSNNGDPAQQTWVTLVDLKTLSVLRTVDTGGGGPHKVAVDTGHHLAYVTHAGPSWIDVVDTETGSIVRRIDTGLAQGGAQNALDLSRGRLYTIGSTLDGSQDEERLVAIDLGTGKQVGNAVALPDGGHGTRVDPVTGDVWTVLEAQGEVAVTDPATMTVVALVPVGHCPYYLDIDPVKRLAYVTNQGDGTISVVDMTKVGGAGSGAAAGGAPAATTGCVVPALRGLKLAAAKAALRRAHCGVGKLARVKAAASARGTVVGQSPRAGKHLEAGVRVVLRVGR